MLRHVSCSTACCTWNTLFLNQELSALIKTSLQNRLPDKEINQLIALKKRQKDRKDKLLTKDDEDQEQQEFDYWICIYWCECFSAISDKLVVGGRKLIKKRMNMLQSNLFIETQKAGPEEAAARGMRKQQRQLIV